MIAQQIKIGIAAALIGLCATIPVLAQQSYDLNCKIIPPESDQGTLIGVCRSHLACDGIVRTQSGICKTNSFLDKVGKIFAGKGKLETDDVVEAAKPDDADSLTSGMRSHAATMTAEQRARRDAEDHERQLRNGNAANDGPGFTPDLTVLPPKRQGGYIGIFEGSGTPKDGQGTLIGDDGVTKGNFKNGKLEGEGEQILTDGTYRGGNYKDGQIAGKGFEFGVKDGKTAVTEGTFKADEPDGLALVTYEDKSSERVRWENGKIIEHGPRAAPGTVPALLKPMSDIELAIAGHQPSDLVIGNLVNGTGMIERVRKDGTAQFEEWEDGQIVQVGVRKNKADALAPQQRPKPASHHQVASNGPLPEGANPDPAILETPRRTAPPGVGWAATPQQLIDRCHAEIAEVYAANTEAGVSNSPFAHSIADFVQSIETQGDSALQDSLAYHEREYAAGLRSSSRKDYTAWEKARACLIRAHLSRSPEKAPRRDPNVLFCRTEAEEMLATIEPSNPNKSSWTPILTTDGARDVFLDQITTNYAGLGVLRQFHLDMGNLNENVRSQAGIGNRVFLRALHDAYSRPASNWSEEWWHKHDLWMACWALAEAKRLN
jgi:hypothetical protein